MESCSPNSVMTIEKARTLGKNMLSLSFTPLLDVDCILSHILKKERTYILLHRDDILSERESAQAFRCFEMRKSGLPVAYITGHKEFYGLDFCVTRDVLIPKPDTELLVERALIEINTRIKAGAGTAGGAPFAMADVCTGSGCVAVSTLSAATCRDNIKTVCTDISAPALMCAKENARRLLPPSVFSNITFLQGDLLLALSGKGRGCQYMFNMILSNPPYVPAPFVDKLLSDGRGEPRIALNGDAGSGSTDGLGIIRHLIPQAHSHLKSGGLLLLETGEYNAEAAAQLLMAAGFVGVETFKDISGLLRVTQGRAPAPAAM